MEQSQIDDLLQKFNSLSEDEIIALFDPKEAQTIPVEVLSLMPTLTSEQINILAKAYPNTALNTAYLILKDKDFKGKPLYPRSTWANLADLRRAGLRNWFALTFTSRWKGDDTSMQSVLNVAPVQDLTKEEVKNAAGIKPEPLTVAATQTSKAENDATKQQEPQGEAKTLEPGTSAQTGNEALKTENNEGSENETFPDLKDEAAKLADGVEANEANKEAGAKDEAANATEQPAKTVHSGRKRH